MRRRDGGTSRRARWRCGARSGGRLAERSVHLLARCPRAWFAATLPGGFGNPPCRYYGPCARSSLMARFHLGTHKRGPETGADAKASAQSRIGAPRGVRLIAMGRATPSPRRGIIRMRHAALHPPAVAQERYGGQAPEASRPLSAEASAKAERPGRICAAGMRPADRNPQRKNPYNARRLREIPPSGRVYPAGAGIDSRRA
jgi:hypothetical protein